MQRRFIPALMLFVALLLLLAGLGARMTSVPAISFAAEAKEIYLTFDDGPSTSVTEKVLDILKEEDVRATFFIVGDRVQGREKTLRRIAAEGHTLGVHSQTHVYSEIYSSADALLRDAESCAETIRRVTGISPRVYRFPGGGKHPASAKLLRKRGYTIVSWNAVCGDEEIRGADADTLYASAVKTAEGKDPVILLLHDSASHRPTAEALPRIIAHFRAEGYTFSAF